MLPSPQTLVEGERDQLQSHVAELESVQGALEGEVATLRGQLTAEEGRSRALDGSRQEVYNELVDFIFRAFSELLSVPSACVTTAGC